MAALLPPTLARASAALGRTLMPVAEGGAFRLQLLDAREASTIMHMFDVSAEAYKYIHGVWTSVRVYRPGATDGPVQPANRSVFICYSVVVQMDMDDWIFFAEWQANNNDEEWPQVRTVTRTFDPEDRRKILTVSTQVHPGLINMFMEHEDHTRIWEAQLLATRQLTETAVPVVELIGKV